MGIYEGKRLKEKQKLILPQKHHKCTKNSSAQLAAAEHVA